MVTDTVPYGLCPLGGAGSNFAPGAPVACAGAAGTAPTTPFDSVTQNPDGTFTVVLDPVSLPADGSLTVHYFARMLNTYVGGPLAGEPTVIGDSFTNRAVAHRHDHPGGGHR